MEMSDWRAKNLEDLAKVNHAIRSEQEAKKEANKEFNENIKGLEAARDQILDKLTGGEEKALFEDEPTHPRIELDEDDPGPSEDDAPEPGTYLGPEDDEDDPANYFAE